ncbi:hypothetical protein C4F40_04025 [Sphingobacterium sp. Ka21]|uniref:Uncharacterized protein n=1 Tax=Sphingobacterium pedocola TaxID=2082722 RepID=A0ABR9T3H0_9SPHI|nr:hypothetical protein [Sphingobacterium pedocola]
MTKCPTLTRSVNVALVDRGLQEGRNVVASQYSDDFFFLFIKKGRARPAVRTKNIIQKKPSFNTSNIL